MASPVASLVVAMGSDGRVSSQGSLSKALEHNKLLAREVAEEREKIAKVESSIDGEESNPQDKKKTGKLVVAEEVAEGHLGWSARESINRDITTLAHQPIVKLYLSNLGGRHVLIFWMGILAFLFFAQAGETLQMWFLGYWAEQYEQRPADQVKVP